PGLEEAISLAATICWEWCRQRGDHFVLALAGTSSVVLRGTTGWAHALHLLGCLAGLEGEKDPDATVILERLSAEPLPPAFVLVVSSRDPAPLQAALSLRLHRPIVGLGIEGIGACDFYEKPAPSIEVPTEIAKPSGNDHGT